MDKQVCEARHEAGGKFRGESFPADPSLQHLRIHDETGTPVRHHIFQELCMVVGIPIQRKWFALDPEKLRENYQTRVHRVQFIQIGNYQLQWISPIMATFSRWKESQI
jgi:hypothetical protein